jgi:hypothetical protein
MSQLLSENIYLKLTAEPKEGAEDIMISLCFLRPLWLFIHLKTAVGESIPLEGNT